MEFDVNEYVSAMEEFMLKMDEIPTIVNAGISDAMERICKVLRICKVDAAAYSNEEDARTGKGDKVVFFDKGDADEVNKLSVRKMTADNNIALYNVYKKRTDIEWSEIEKEKIDFFVRMLFIYNSRSRAVQIAEYLTFHDKDFGVYNLAYFLRQAGKYIGQKRIGQFAVCYFNIRRLSAINQMVGRDRATVLMMDFIRGLERMLSEGEFISRIGGDNFIVMFLKERNKQVEDYLSGHELVYDEKTGDKLVMSATGGFYLIPEDLATPLYIMDGASIAINMAKNVERKQFVYYDEALMLKMKSKKIIETMFPEALEKGEFQVYYQPKVRLTEYRLAGAEALCRWIHGDKRIVPDDFIPILEQSHAICTLDFYVLEQVCKDIRQWIDEGKDVVRVSVNMSRRHMGDPNLLNRILSIIDKYNVPHEYIEIELTETTTDVAFGDLKEIVFGLQANGISTSVDDFGVGYSSLNLIKELPWNVIKIDKSFLEKHESNRSNYIMLKQVIVMAQELGMEVIVEGVETVEHIKMLKENNCYMAQGFYFDRPLPKDEFVKRILM